MPAFDQVNTTGAAVNVPSLGRTVQPGEVVTSTDLIVGFTPVPSPSDDVAAATAQLEQDVAGAPTVPDTPADDNGKGHGNGPKNPAKQKAAAAPQKEV